MCNNYKNISYMFMINSEGYLHKSKTTIILKEVIKLKYEIYASTLDLATKCVFKRTYV